MGLTTKASGTWSPTTTGTTTLTTNSDEGVYLFSIDMSAMDNGDKITLVFKNQCLSSGSEEEQFKILLVNEQGEPFKVAIPVLSIHSMSVTAKYETTGHSGDTYPWSLVTLQDGGITTEGSGSRTATVGTEFTLHTETDARTLVFTLDTSNLQDGDDLEATIETRAGSGGPNVVAWKRRWTNNQSLPLKQSLPVTSMHQAVFKIRQTAGTARSIPWSVESVATD